MSHKTSAESGKDKDGSADPDEETFYEAKDIHPSAVGTKDYWDNWYDNEKKNFEEGAVTPDGWFGPSVLNNVVKYIGKNSKRNEHILDIGCGSGDILMRLVTTGFNSLTGWDYSRSAIQLCQKQLKRLCEGKDTTNLKIELKEVDIMKTTVDKSDIGRYHIVVDKGTYDAICMNPEINETKVNPTRDIYWRTVRDVLHVDGLFIICSCNWTGAEINEHSSKYFVPYDGIPTLGFKFGGKTGETCSISVLGKFTIDLGGTVDPQPC